MDEQAEGLSGRGATLPSWDERLASGRLGWWVAAAVLLAAAPVLAVSIPPLLDYPSHLARFWILSGGSDGTPVADMYRVDWSYARTNIGLDLLAASLGRLMPATVFGSVMVALALAAAPLGAVALNRSVFGGAHWWQIAFALLAYNQTMLAGFLNFQVALGLALLAAAADALLARRGPWALLAGRVGLAILILTVHAFGLLFYMALLGGLALGRDAAALRAWPAARAAAWRILAAALPLVAVVAVFLSLTPSLPGAADSSGAGVIWQGDLKARISSLVSALTTYVLGIDVLFALALAAPAALALAQRRIHFGLFVAGVGLLLLGALAPSMAANTWWIERRFPLMAALALASAARPELPGRWARPAAALLLAIVAGRAAWIASVWSERQADVRAVQSVLARAPEGSAILVMEHRPTAADANRAPRGRYLVGGPTYWHYGSLAVLERKSFVPFLFAEPGKQPLRVLPPWSEIAVPEGDPAPVNELRDGSADAYVGRWRERFDHLLVLNADLPNSAGPMPQLPELRLVADSGFARLYTISPAYAPVGAAD